MKIEEFSLVSAQSNSNNGVDFVFDFEVGDWSVLISQAKQDSGLAAACNFSHH